MSGALGAILGVALAEEADLAGEICDYEATRPLLAARFAAGQLALQAMHAPGRVGVITDVAFDDGRRRIRIRAEIFDARAWARIVERVWRGLSIGGRYERRWRCERVGLMRYAADVAEISLVDSPGMPSARLRIL